MTYTYAILEVSKEAYDEIKEKLKEAGYQDAFGEEGIIDMHGIALKELAISNFKITKVIGKKKALGYFGKALKVRKHKCQK